MPLPPPPAARPRWASPEAVVSAVLAVLTLAAFLPACGNEFVDYDDRDYVSENPHVLGGLSRDAVTWAVTTNRAANWHPLTWWSLQLDAELFGADPAGYHFTNVALHAGCVVLLFWVLRLATGALWPSAVAAAIFAVHPLRVESVAWAAERKDVLSTFFWMLALLAYVHYARRPGVGRYLLVAAALALGLMAKPMLVTLPFVLLLLDYWPLGRVRSGVAWQLLLEKVPLVALAAAAAAATVAAQSGGAVRTLDQFPLEVRVANALVACVQYLGAFVWPSDLAVFYPHPRPRLLTAQALGAGGLLAALTVVAVREGRRRPYLLVGWLWYLGTLVPVIGLVQVGAQGRADRYTYVPLVGVTVALVWGLAELADRSPRWRTALRLAGVAVVALLVIGTHRQIAHWRDTVSLWEHALATTTDNHVAHRNLAIELERLGRDTEALPHYQKALPLVPDKRVVHNDLGAYWMRHGRPEEALAHFRASLELAPDDPVTHNNLGSLLLLLGRPDEAAAHLQRVVASMPDFAQGHFNLALALAAQGRLPEAQARFAEGRRHQPENADAHRSFGTALADQGKPDLAIPYLEAAVILRPADPEARCDLAVVLQAQGHLDRAITEYREAVRIGPPSVKYFCGLAHACRAAGQADEAAVYYRAAGRLDPTWPAQLDERAWRLAVHPDARKRKGTLAVQLAEQVCQATEFQSAGFVDTLAAAYAEVGRFPDAAVTARKAARRAADERQPALAKEIEDRARLYESGRPFRAELVAGDGRR